MSKNTKFSTKTPEAGDVVFIALRKRPVNPGYTDVVKAIYGGSYHTAAGQPVYSVLLNSGDAVDVVAYKNGWKAFR